MLVGDHTDLTDEFTERASRWIRSGHLRYQETVVEGVENTVEAFLGLLRGENTGKMIVKLHA
jgi:NADPH-dependent curcumin reductase CurA